MPFFVKKEKHISSLGSNKCMETIILLLLFFLCVIHMVWFFYEINCVKVSRIAMKNEKNEADKVLELCKMKLAKISIMLSVVIFVFSFIILFLVAFFIYYWL